jgi:hypothetical protein
MEIAGGRRVVGRAPHVVERPEAYRLGEFPPFGRHDFVQYSSRHRRRVHDRRCDCSGGRFIGGSCYLN